MRTTKARNETLERFAKEDSQNLRSDFAAVLAMREGRRILTWIVHEASGIYRTSAGDATALAADAGRRNLGLEILMQARIAAPDMVFEAERELETLTRKRAEELSLANGKDADADKTGEDK